MKKALFVAWRTRDLDHPGWGPVGRLEFDEGLYRFFYTHGANSLLGFQPFSQMDDLDQVYESTELFPLFANRLLSERRPEYEAYLRWSGFEHANPPDPMTILAVTEGQRQTDAIEVFPCPVPDLDGCYLNRFFLHGIRWTEDAGREYIAEQLQDGEQLRLVPEPANIYDPYAVAIYPQHGKDRLGYAPRYLAHDIHMLLRDCDPDYVTLLVDLVNMDAPLQQRVLCQMQSCWPDGFRRATPRHFSPSREAFLLTVRHDRMPARRVRLGRH